MERKAEVEELWRQGGISVYSATSVELLEALIGIVTPRCRELMHSTALVTGSQRVADAAVRLGLGSPLVLADSPEDAALVGALVRWRVQAGA
jgi:uroporphyrinogen-III synthase